MCENCTDTYMQTLKLSKLDRNSSNVAVMAGETEMCEVVGWKRLTIGKTDKEDESVTVIWDRDGQLLSFTFILTWKLCCHLMPSPCHPMSAAPHHLSS